MKNNVRRRLQNLKNTPVHSIYLFNDSNAISNTTATEYDLTTTDIVFRFETNTINSEMTFTLFALSNGSYSQAATYKFTPTSYVLDVTLSEIQYLSPGTYNLSSAIDGEEDISSSNDNGQLPNYILFTVTKERLTGIELSLKEGWNLISGITDYSSTIDNTNNVVDTNSLFKFSSKLGYRKVDDKILVGGNGYWIRAIKNGIIKLDQIPSTTPAAAIAIINQTSEAIQDAAVKALPTVQKSTSLFGNIMRGNSGSSRESYISYINRIQSAMNEAGEALISSANDLANTKNELDSTSESNAHHTALISTLKCGSVKNMKLGDDVNTLSQISSIVGNGECSANSSDRLNKPRKKRVYRKVSFTETQSNNPMKILNDKIKAFETARDNYLYPSDTDDTDELYETFKKASDDVIKAITDLGTSSKNADSTEKTKKMTLQIIGGQNGSQLADGKYVITGLGYDNDPNNSDIWDEDTQDIRLNITHNMDNDGLWEQRITNELLSWSGGDFLWKPDDKDYYSESKSGRYVNVNDDTKFLKFIQYNTDDDAEADIIRVVTNDDPNEYQESTVSLIESNKNIALQKDKLYSVKITADSTTQIPSIPSYHNGSEFEFTVFTSEQYGSINLSIYNKNFVNNWSRGDLYESGSTPIYYQEDKYDQIGEQLITRDEYNLEFNNNNNKSAILWQLEETNYTQKILFNGSYEEYDISQKNILPENRTLKDESNNIYRVPRNSKGFYLIKLGQYMSEDYYKYDFASDTGSDFLIYEYLASSDSYVKGTESIKFNTSDKTFSLGSNTINYTFDGSIFTFNRLSYWDYWEQNKFSFESEYTNEDPDDYEFELQDSGNHPGFAYFWDKQPYETTTFHWLFGIDWWMDDYGTGFDLPYFNNKNNYTQIGDTNKAELLIDVKIKVYKKDDQGEVDYNNQVDDLKFKVRVLIDIEHNPLKTKLLEYQSSKSQSIEVKSFSQKFTATKNFNMTHIGFMSMNSTNGNITIKIKKSDTEIYNATDYSFNKIDFSSGPYTSDTIYIVYKFNSGIDLVKDQEYIIELESNNKFFINSERDGAKLLVSSVPVASGYVSYIPFAIWGDEQATASKTITNDTSSSKPISTSSQNPKKVNDKKKPLVTFSKL